MYKVDLEKEEEPEIRVGHNLVTKQQERKTRQKLLLSFSC